MTPRHRLLLVPCLLSLPIACFDGEMQAVGSDATGTETGFDEPPDPDATSSEPTDESSSSDAGEASESGGSESEGGDTEPLCGDGVLDPQEECDDGTNAGHYGGCNPDCTLAPACGDGVVDDAHGEACDDGNAIPADGCNPDCRPSGQIEWVRTYGSAEQWDAYWGVAVRDDGVISAVGMAEQGYEVSAVWASYESDGSLRSIHAEQGSGSGDNAYDATTFAVDGRVWIAGRYADANGSQRRLRSAEAEPTMVASFGSGRYIDVSARYGTGPCVLGLASDFSSAAVLLHRDGGDVAWTHALSQEYRPQAVAMTPSGDCRVLYDDGYGYMYSMVLDGAGPYPPAQGVEGPTLSNVDIVVDAEGNWIIAGNSNAYLADYSIVQKYAPDGTLLWSELYASEDSVMLRSVDVGADGSVVASGTSFETVTTGLVTRLDAEGEPLWTQQFALDDAQTHALSVAIGPDLEVYVAGAVREDPMTGVYDAFVLRMTP